MSINIYSEILLQPFNSLYDFSVCYNYYYSHIHSNNCIRPQPIWLDADEIKKDYFIFYPYILRPSKSTVRYNYDIIHWFGQKIPNVPFVLIIITFTKKAKYIVTTALNLKQICPNVVDIKNTILIVNLISFVHQYLLWNLIDCIH